MSGYSGTPITIHDLNYNISLHPTSASSTATPDVTIIAAANTDLHIAGNLNVTLDYANVYWNAARMNITIGGDMIEKAGKSSGILLAALISMNLAILNILPIPALDGGHLIFLFVEKVMGRPLDEKVIENISSVFFSLLIILMIFVVFNDITLLVGK